MNKIKFLSCAVMAAFFAMGITSCEKENFDTKVDVENPTITIPGVTPENPGDAAVAINPTVMAVINGEISDVTSKATITYNGKAALDYAAYKNADGSISKFDVEIVATYTVNETELTATKTVSVPALSAGQVIMITPTLVISATFEEGEGDGEGEGEGEGEKVSVGLVTELIEGSTSIVKKAGEIEFDNASKYYYTNVTGTSANEYAYGTFIEKAEVKKGYEENADVKDILGSYNQGKKNYKITVKGFNLWPETKTCFAVEQIAETKSYTIKEQFETRAITEATAATFTVTDYSYIVSTTPKYYNTGEGHNGHGHAHSQGHGHGHDHGHGYDNAGGGIVSGF